MGQMNLFRLPPKIPFPALTVSVLTLSCFPLWLTPLPSQAAPCLPDHVSCRISWASIQRLAGPQLWDGLRKIAVPPHPPGWKQVCGKAGGGAWEGSRGAGVSRPHGRGLMEEGPGSADHPGLGASVWEACVRVEEGNHVHEQLLERIVEMDVTACSISEGPTQVLLLPSPVDTHSFPWQP